MPRAAFQVLVLPYRRNKGRLEYAVLQRSDCRAWQFVAGGGEAGESPAAAARREALEEAGIATSRWLRLDSRASIPRTAFSDADHWPPNVLVVPEHAFAVEPSTALLWLSHEHVESAWLSYEEALARLRWDSNRTALWELDQRLRRLPSGQIRAGEALRSIPETGSC